MSEHPGGGAAYLTVAQVAERLAVRPKTVYQQIWSGRLRAVKVGGAVRVAESDLADYLAANAAGPAGGKASRPAAGRKRSRPTKAGFRFFPPPETPQHAA